MKKLIKGLENPSSEFRGHPFWSWNDKLECEELRRQIREMKRVGLGGYFMHARGGLITEYLSEDWFDCIKACVDEGKKLGMESWSYDENGWPSGFGGGIVSGMGDRYHVRWLFFGKYEPRNTPEGKILGFYAIKDGKCRYLDGKIRSARAKAREDEEIWYVAHEKNVNYVDILSPKVVDAFIRCTYDEYAKQLGGDFGGAAMPGFFTDEPQFSRCKIPWSYVLPKEFEKEHGYDIHEGLALLFGEYEGYEKFRFDFWKVVSRLYTESFGKKIYEWCCKHNCKWTGHAMMEDNLYAQMACTAGVMPLYEYMHIPGMDWLGRSIGNPLIPKQVGSAAKQLGKKLVLSETYACCGWDVSFEELKWIAEWQYINGINWMCQHLEGYSIRGLRKRDYPPSMFYQSPWWDDYKTFNDYFARLGKLIAESDEQADVLLIHPMHTGYITYNGSNCPAIQSYDNGLRGALNILSGNHIGYHLGDEVIMRGHGSVEGDALRVGECVYHTVVLPMMKTLDKSTLELLSEYMANGGKIYALGEKPSLVDGAPSEELAALMEQVPVLPTNDGELLTYSLVESGLKQLSVTNKNGEIGCIHCRVNLVDGGKVYFFQNQDREHGYDAKIVLDTDADARIIDLSDMSVRDAKAYKSDGRTTLALRFEPMQSYTVMAGDSLPEITDKAKPCFELPLGNEWRYDGGDDNALTLDTCQYILGEGDEYSEPKNVLDVMEILLSERANDKIKLRFTFELAENTRVSEMRSMKLVSEFTDEFKISVNGSEVRSDGGWWLDRSFKTCDIRPFVKPGVNEIVIDGSFFQRQKVYDVLFGKNVLETERNKLTYDTELESLYLVGDFTVWSRSGYTDGARRATFTDGGFVITNRDPEQVFHGGEIVKQGYPFFTGRIRLSQEIKIKKSYGKRIKVKIAKPYAALAKVYVDDTLAGELLWSDYELDITDFVVPGKVAKLTVEPVVTNRNLMGPHHRPDGESYGISPASFSPHGKYDIYSWRSRYCFVKAGIGE